MAKNTLESVWDVGVSNALGWNFICWFPSLYILDYLVPPLLKDPGSALALCNCIAVYEYEFDKYMLMCASIIIKDHKMKQIINDLSKINP